MRVWTSKKWPWATKFSVLSAPGATTLFRIFRALFLRTYIGSDLKFACVIKGHSGTATRDIPVYLDMLTHVGTESALIP